MERRKKGGNLQQLVDLGRRSIECLKTLMPYNVELTPVDCRPEWRLLISQRGSLWWVT